MKSDALLLSDIEINNFIFHIVHHGQDEATLLNKTPLKEYTNFFKQKIIDVYEGNKFSFSEQSEFLKKILEIEENPRKFIAISKSLAILLHAHQNHNIKPGVMILMRATVRGENKCILIKYDNDDVITYKATGDEAILQEISNTFSKNKDALQKSVIVNFDSKVYATVIDRSDRQNITQFFKGFLGIERNYSEKELTEKLREAFLATVREHKLSLPSTFTKNVNQIFYDIIQNIESFEQNEFTPMAFGAHYRPEYDNTFKRELRKKDILGESFNVDKSLPKPKKKKIRTAEGVLIQYESFAEDTVEIGGDEHTTIITITTKQITVE